METVKPSGAHLRGQPGAVGRDGPVHAAADPFPVSAFTIARPPAQTAKRPGPDIKSRGAAQ